MTFKSPDGQVGSKQVVICERCQGTGRSTYPENDDETWRTYYVTKDCHLCEGSGRLFQYISYKPFKQAVANAD
jgi:DnaJ-class molecular chaperone